MTSDIVTSVKTGATVAATTASVGLSTWFEWIPDDIGKLASLIGLVLSLVLICVHLHSAWVRHRRFKNDGNN